MRGMRHIHTQRDSKRIISILFALLITCLLLTACAGDFADHIVGDGRGDWTKPLMQDYYLCKVNSREILVVHKENPGQSNGRIIIPNYYVTAYQINESVILVEGILTEGPHVTENEIKTNILNYYAIDTKTDTIYGPFDSKISLYESLETNNAEDWIASKE